MTHFFPRTPLALIALTSLAVSGCVVHTRGSVRTVHTVEANAYAPPSYVTVQTAPPPLRETAQHGAKPEEGAVWVSGHWRWSGRWVWDAGRWENARPGYTWEPPVVVGVASGGYQYHPGYWRAESQAPPQVYRTPGTIRVHAIPAGREPEVQRVVVQANRPPETRVVVQGAAPTGRSASVTVRATARATAPGNGTTVRATPGRGNGTTVRATPGRGNSTTVRAAPPGRGDDTTVRATPPGRGNSTTVRANGRESSTVRGSASGSVSVRAGRGNSSTTRATPARGNPSAARPATPSNARPARSTREAGTVTARPATPSNARPARSTREAGAVTTSMTTSMGASVSARPHPPRSAMAAPPSMNVRVQPQPRNIPVSAREATCRPAVSVLPSNGMVVLRGTNLQGTTEVDVGGAAAVIVSKSNAQVRARVSGLGGNVRVTVGGRRINCGRVRAAGR